MAVRTVVSVRRFWSWLDSVFNRVDPDRIKEVGPDRACAEWLLRCGANVKFNRTSDFIRDYNFLVAADDKFKIEAIDADGASIMHEGFRHLRGLTQLKKIRFHNCQYINNSALAQLIVVKDTLHQLEISKCYNVSDKGFPHLYDLINLKELLLSDLPSVKDPKGSLTLLRSALPSCKITYQDATQK